MAPSSSKMKKPAAVAASPKKASPKKQAKLSQDKQVVESALKGLPVPELVLVKEEKPSPKKPSRQRGLRRLASLCPRMLRASIQESLRRKQRP